jgi:hypothetical protein
MIKSNGLELEVYPNKYAMARFNYFITKSTNVLAKQKKKNTLPV